MGTITTTDGTEIFSNYRGSGQPVVFSHGWPLNAGAWDDQMMFMASNGYRAIARDRRGRGRSSQPWTGNDMDTYAHDLAQLIDTLDLRDVILAGHCTGGGDVTRYAGRHGTSRVVKVVRLDAIPPLMLKTPTTPTAARSRPSMWCQPARRGGMPLGIGMRENPPLRADPATRGSGTRVAEHRIRALRTPATSDRATYRSSRLRALRAGISITIGDGVRPRGGTCARRDHPEVSAGLVSDPLPPSVPGWAPEDTAVI